MYADTKEERDDVLRQKKTWDSENSHTTRPEYLVLRTSTLAQSLERSLRSSSVPSLERSGAVVAITLTTIHNPRAEESEQRAGGWVSECMAITRQDDKPSSIETHDTVGVTLSQFESYRPSRVHQ